MKSFGAVVVHAEKAESLGERDAIGTRLEELDMRGDSAEDGDEIHGSERALWDRAFGENSRSTRQRKALHDPDEPLVVRCENSSFLIGNANTGSSHTLAGILAFLSHVDD